MKRQKVSTLTGNSKAIAAALTLPSAVPPVRFSNEYTTTTTAVAAPAIRTPVKWGQFNNPITGTTRLDANGVQLPLTDWFGAFFRDPLRAAVIYRQNPGINQAGVAVYARSIYVWQSQHPDTTVFPIEPNGSTEIRPSHAKAGDFVGVINEWSPHGEYLYASEGEDKKYMYVDGRNNPTVGTRPYNPVFVVVTSAVELADIWTYHVYAYQNGADRYITSINNAAGTTTTFNVASDSAYFRIEVEFIGTTAAASTSVSIASQSCVDQFAHLPLQDIDSNSDDLQSIRVISIGMLLQNIAADLVKQGKVVGLQSGKNESWTSYAFSGGTGTGNQAFTKILSSSDQRDFELSRGIYGFIKPSDDTDFDMGSPFIIDANGIWAQTNTNVVDDSEFAMIMASTSNIPSSADCFLNVDHHVEFETRNRWRESKVPTTTPSDWKGALTRIRFMRQWYNNKVHFDEILDMIGKGIATALPLILLATMAK